MIEIQMDVYDFFMLEILYHKVFSSAWMNIIFQFWHFSPIFVQLKLTCLVTLAKIDHFCLFNELLSNQNVNETFSVIFKHCVTAKFK